MRWNQTALCELSKTEDCQVLTESIRMLPGTLATGDTCKKRAAQSKEARDVWNSLTVGQAVRVETTRRGESNPRSLEVPSQFNREGSLQALCRLAAREERRERLLRIIGPHSLREHF